MNRPAPPDLVAGVGDDFADLFAPGAAAEQPGPPASGAPWDVLLVDDDPGVHGALRLALQDLRYEGRGLRLIDAGSGAEARQLLVRHPDVALVLLDLVMETEHAGLELVHHLRHERNDALVQIVVLTGQPGYAPRRELVVTYEINDYCLKSELSSDRIFVAVYTALRTRGRLLEQRRQHQQLQRQTLLLERQRRQMSDHQEELERQVGQRTAELERRSQHLAEIQFAMDRAGIAIAWCEFDSGRTLYVNDEACRQLGYSRDELLQLTVRDINPEAGTGRLDPVRTWLSQSDHAPPFETLHRRKDGSVYPAEVTVYRRSASGNDGLILFFSDISERRHAAREAEAQLRALERSNLALEALNTRLTQMHTQLVHAEKMASIGQLAAGIAHEINNPVGYVRSNVNALQRYIQDFQRMLDAFAAAERGLPGHEAAFAEVHRLAAEIEFDYAREDVGALLAESVSGLERVAKIVHDLKNFARADDGDAWAPGDLHQGLESTLNVIWNQLKYTCEVRREYGELPLVPCVLPQINQVFMNLLVNAAQAIETRGTITIATGTAGAEAWVEIADTGKGIAPEHLERIFLPFFTTKPVGSGTGLGLSISYSIVQRHHGRIEVHSTPGQGSRFRVWLPLEQPDCAPAPAGDVVDGESAP